MPPKHKKTIANKFVGFVGNIPFDRALKRRMSRHGNLVRSQRRPFSTSQEKAIANSLERHTLKIHKLSQKKKQPKSLSRWKQRAEILKKMAALGFKPQAMHLVAGLAFEHGLSKDKLLPVINAFRNANDHSNNILFRGSMGVPSYAARLNLFSKMHGLLQEKAKTLTAHQVASALGIDYNNAGVYSAINCAFGVLDLMGLSRKLPRDGKRNYRWVHARYRFNPITIPKQNLDWKILQKLRGGDLKETDLCLPIKLPDGRKIGSKNGLATNGSIRDSFSRMQKAGLVSTFVSANSLRARLTDFGINLLQEQDKLNYLHPKLRIALLGLARQPGELLPKKQRMLNRILRWVRTHRALSQTRKEMGANKPTFEYLAASRKLGEKSRYVFAVANGYLPWRRVKESELRGFYLEQLRKNHPLEAKYFEEIILRQQTRLQTHTP